ncbi:MAG: 7-carboxy-7-deazaguanine synthase QueE, partial [Muribaculum sp.]|nr:7-carboxy-7-deazaguanine synthase QueE [Muribaculum sp.]
MKVNEIFYSLQGEGLFTGTAAVFVRLSGCNLTCDFCDTHHDEWQEMSEREIVDAVKEYPATHVVITGGEPTLQLTASLVEMLHAARRYVQIETNGSVPVDAELVKLVDWITCSPKYGMLPRIGRIDELKVVYDKDRIANVVAVESVTASYYCLQPCDRGEEGYNMVNLKSCIDYILAHPKWKLSL